MSSNATLRRAEDRGRRDGRLSWLSRIVFVISIILLLITIIMRIYAQGVIPDVPPTIDTIIFISTFLANALVGLLIIARYPQHMVGWLLLSFSFVGALTGISESLAALNEYTLVNPANLFVKFFVWVARWIWFLLVALPIVFIPLYFPNGQLLSKRWRIVALAGVIGTLIAIVSLAVDPRILDAAAVSAGDQESATSLVALVAFLARYFFPPLFFVAIVGSLVSVVLRYRRANREERTQMKWVIYILVLGITVALIIDPFFQYVMPEIDQETKNNFSNEIISSLAFALPVFIGIAILRYRLYDIDLIIRRTLIYGALTLTLALIYLGSVILLQSVLGFLVTSESPLVLVVSTLAIAALFNPLRRRIQDVIDRRFYRRKYDARATLNQFAAAMREESDLQDLVGRLAAVVEETMQPEVVTVWLAKPPAEKPDQEYSN